MNLNNFENKIHPVILRRGREYFTGGYVRELIKVDETKWVAVVSDTYNYQVLIRLNDAELISWNCECPYDEEPVCKHVAAVLYKLSEKIVQPKEPGGNLIDFPKKPVSEKKSLKNLIKKIPQKELQKFVEKYAESNSKFRNMFLTNFSDYFIGGNKSEYRQLIVSFVNSCSGRDGFIDYKGIIELEKYLSDLLNRAEEMANASNLRQSFSICSALIEELPNILDKMINITFDVEEIIDDAFDLMDFIICNSNSDGFDDELFDYCIKEIKKSKYEKWGYDLFFSELLLTCVTNEEKEKKAFAFLDNIISGVSAENEHKAVAFIKLKIDFLNDRKRKKEACQLLNKYLHFHKFREMDVKETISKKNYKKAIELINEGIEIAQRKNQWGIVKIWKDMLIKIAEKENDWNSYRIISGSLFFECNYDFSYYRKLKKTYDKDEWKDEVGNIINQIKDKNKHSPSSKKNILAKVFAEENYKDRLLSLLQSEKISLDLLNEFSPYVFKDYPGEILNTYRNLLNQYTKKSGKSIYNEVAKAMNIMNKIKGGKTIVSEIISEYSEQYKNRPAMLRTLMEKVKK